MAISTAVMAWTVYFYSQVPVGADLLISGGSRYISVHGRTITMQQHLIAPPLPFADPRARHLERTWHGSRLVNTVQDSLQVRGTTICNG